MADVVDYQYLRKCTLVVSNSSLKGLDLSQLRIKFQVKRSDTMTPNCADIRVYNLSDETAVQIKKEFTNVILQAGYESNFGVIFRGNIKQVIIGRESATDTFIDIIAGDGDRGYNFAIVNTTLAAGATQSDQIKAASSAMATKGITTGNLGNSGTVALPRGKVLYSQAKYALRNTAQSTNQAWSIQDGQINFIPFKSYLPGTAVVLTSKTGMIGTPNQTNEGVNVKCLLNPNIRIGARLKIDNKSIERLKINLSISDPKQIAASSPAPLSADGTYYVLVAEHSGDTRGTDWYTSVICLNIDVTTNPANSVQVGYGG